MPLAADELAALADAALDAAAGCQGIGRMLANLASKEPAIGVTAEFRDAYGGWRFGKTMC